MFLICTSSRVVGSCCRRQYPSLARRRMKRLVWGTTTQLVTDNMRHILKLCQDSEGCSSPTHLLGWLEVMDKQDITQRLEGMFLGHQHFRDWLRCREDSEASSLLWESCLPQVIHTGSCLVQVQTKGRRVQLLCLSTC